jgi:hypothetical protein
MFFNFQINKMSFLQQRNPECVLHGLAGLVDNQTVLALMHTCKNLLNTVPKHLTVSTAVNLVEVPVDKCQMVTQGILEIPELPKAPSYWPSIPLVWGLSGWKLSTATEPPKPRPTAPEPSLELLKSIEVAKGLNLSRFYKMTTLALINPSQDLKIPELPQIKTLILGKFTNFNQLDRFPNLEDLELQDQWLSRSEMVALFAKIPPTVKHLTLYLVGYTEHDIMMDWPNLPNLESLVFNRTYMFRSLNDNYPPSLKEMTVIECDRMHSSLKRLRSLTNLKVLNFADIPPSEINSSNFPSLDVLNIECEPYTYNMIETLTYATTVQSVCITADIKDDYVVDPNFISPIQVLVMRDLYSLKLLDHMPYLKVLKVNRVVLAPEENLDKLRQLSVLTYRPYGDDTEITVDLTAPELSFENFRRLF